MVINLGAKNEQKPTAAMKHNLDRLVENITTGDDSEDYQRERGYLDEYIRQGTTPFTHRWYDDFLEKDCEVSYTATQVIYDLRMELCIPLAEFLQAPSESLFRAIMAKAYFLTMGYVRHHLTGKPRDTGVSVRDSQFAFLASLFFSRDEQSLSFAALQTIIANPDECIRPQETDAARTLIPLSFRLAQDHLALPIDQTQADLFAFSELYQTAYAGFDSSDAEQVKQIFNDLADYHIQQSRTDKNRYPEFEYPLEQWMPWEILALLRLRTQKGLDNSMISHPLITPFLPFVGLEPGGFFDDAQKNLRRAVFKEFGYQPVVDL